MKNRVIVCGYPKSGSTWLTRLTAEILDCPARGFWCQPFNKEESIEGLERESNFECFKAHHTFEQMNHSLSIYGNGSEKLICIVRDPRSIIVSASHYFDFGPQYPRLYKLSEIIPGGVRLYKRFLQTRSYMLTKMTKGLVEGVPQKGWLRTPWSNHVLGYQDKGEVLLVQYEALVTDPLAVTRKIASFLSIDRSEEELKDATTRQSFGEKKKSLQADGRLDDAGFLRAGKIEEWRSELPKKNLDYIQLKIGDFMQSIGYQCTSSPV